MVSLAPPSPLHSDFRMGLPLFLASFPKSGNTWIRIFLGNYLADGAHPLPLNDLRYFAHIADTSLFEGWIGCSPWELSPARVALLRRELHGALHRDVERIMFYKVHDNFFLPDGVTRMFPEGCARVVYVLRNPLDVAISVKHHFDLASIDAAIDYVAGRRVSFAHLGHNRTHMRQFIGSWSQHVRGWCEASGMEMLILRYEDLLNNSRQSFEDLLRFLHWPMDATRFERALNASWFSRLQAAERAQGFAEHYAGQSLFFRSGRAGDWRSHLLPSHLDRMLSEHGEVMKKHGYLEGMQ